MKRIGGLTVLALLAALMLWTGDSVSAQIPSADTGKKMPAVTLGSSQSLKMTESAKLESFRQDLTVYFGEMRDLAQMLADNSFGNPHTFSAVLENIGQIGQVQRDLPQMSATELYYLHQVFAQNPEWMQAPQLLKSVFTPEIVSRVKEIARAYQEKKIVKNEAGRIVEMQTAPCTVPSSGVLNQIGIYVLKGLDLAAEIVKEAIPEDTTSAVPHGIAVAAWAVLKTATLIAEGILEVDNECADQNFQYRVDNFMTDVQPRILDIQQKVTDIQAQTTEIRKREIEESVDLCRPIISVYLPEPYGRLGEVRDFVQLFITNTLTAATCGTTTPCTLPPLTGFYLVAQNYQTWGVTSMTAPNKRYKEAFQYFCKAYAALVRAGDNP